VPEVEEVREKGIRDEKAANLKTGRKRQETRKSSPALLYGGYKGEGEKTIKNEDCRVELTMTLRFVAGGRGQG